MAPEQLLASRLSPATDLYAMGVLLYELLTGALPFDPTLPPAVLAQHHLAIIPAPPAGVPAPVASVVMRALAKDPAARQDSARAFALDLARAAAAVYGPGWAARAGIGLRLDDDIRAAAVQHPASALPQPSPTSPTAAPSTDGSQLPTRRADAPPPGIAPSDGMHHSLPRTPAPYTPPAPNSPYGGPQGQQSGYGYPHGYGYRQQPPYGHDATMRPYYATWRFRFAGTVIDWLVFGLVPTILYSVGVHMTENSGTYPYRSSPAGGALTTLGLIIGLASVLFATYLEGSRG